MPIFAANCCTFSTVFLIAEKQHSVFGFVCTAAGGAELSAVCECLREIRFDFTLTRKKGEKEKEAGFFLRLRMWCTREEENRELLVLMLLLLL